MLEHGSADRSHHMNDSLRVALNDFTWEQNSVKVMLYIADDADISFNNDFAKGLDGVDTWMQQFCDILKDLNQSQIYYNYINLEKSCNEIKSVIDLFPARASLIDLSQVPARTIDGIFVDESTNVISKAITQEQQMLQKDCRRKQARSNLIEKMRLKLIADEQRKKYAKAQKEMELSRDKLSNYNIKRKRLKSILQLDSHRENRQKKRHFFNVQRTKLRSKQQVTIESDHSKTDQVKLIPQM